VIFTVIVATSRALAKAGPSKRRCVLVVTSVLEADRN